MYEKNLICLKCKSSFPVDDPVWQCEECGSLLKVSYDFQRIKEEARRENLKLRPTNLWHYRKFLPVKDDTNIVSLGEGWTPIVSSRYFAKKLGLKLSFKLEFLNPTSSFKDRGTTVMLSKLKELGVKKVADDSSGNAGSSLACYAAKEGLNCTIYTPEHASKGKLSQIKMYGAKLKTIPSFRDKVTQKIKADCRDNQDLYYASHNLNPFFLEGTKTLAYEVAQQLEWQPPDHILFPVGGGGLIVGSYNGFKELFDLGWIKEVPKHHAIQSKACQPIVKAFEEDLNYVPEVEIEETVAEGIHIKKPERAGEILKSIHQSRGSAIAVTEDEILRYYRGIAYREGIFCEPTSAVPLAGLAKLRKNSVIKAGESVLLPITGSGLKDPDTPQQVLL